METGDSDSREDKVEDELPAVAPAAPPSLGAPPIRGAVKGRPPLEAPSFLAVLRGTLFLAAAGAAVILSGRRWAEAYARYQAMKDLDVSGLLAPEAPVPVSTEKSSAGETVKQPRAVVFRLEAPGATAVLLGGTFNGFDAVGTPLSPGGDGAWETTLTLAPGRYLYKFKVDGKWTLDPSNPDRTPSPREASVLEIR